VLEPDVVDVDERVHGCVDLRDVSRREQVEQQATRDGDAQPGVSPGDVGRHATVDAGLGDRVQPSIDDAVQHRGGVRAPLECLAVELEEQTFIGPQGGIGDVFPPGAHRLSRRSSGVRNDLGQDLSLALFDRSDDLDPETLLRPEVVDQHPVTGAERRGQPTQAHIANPVHGHVLNRSVEQLLPDVLATQRPLVYHVVHEPVSVTTNVPQARADVYEFLDVMANHEPFTNHLLHDWEYSGPERGIGSKARVRTKVANRTDVIDIEVVSAQPPATIVEQNIGAEGRRIATGTYTLRELPSGGTQIEFEFRWKQAPLIERLTAPLVRAVVRRANGQALRRLAEQLADRDRGRTPAQPA
jgi:hypothetical protein